jgi:hypothetical protein
VLRRKLLGLKGLTGHVLARRLALQTMSDSRPTESLIEEVAADAAAAYEVARSPNSDGGRIDGDSGSAYDLDSDADSMPDLESLSDTDSIMDLIDDATPCASRFASLFRTQWNPSTHVLLRCASTRV